MRAWTAFVSVLPIVIATELVCPHEAFADDAAPLPSRDMRWYAGLSAAVDTGSLPRTSEGLALGFGVRRGGLGARAVVSMFDPQTDRTSGASVALFDMMGMLCVLGPLGSKVDIGGCGGGGVGLLRGASGPNALRPQGVAVTRLDVGVGPLLVFFAEAGAIVDPLRTSLHLTEAAADYRASLFAFRASLGIQVRLW